MIKNNSGLLRIFRDYVMKNKDLSKLLFYSLSVLIALVFAFTFGLYSGLKRNNVYMLIRTLIVTLENVYNEIPILTKTHPRHFLQPARYEGKGVTVNTTAGDEEELIFLSGFFENNNELRLIRRDGTIVARWPVSFSEIFPDTSHLKYPPITDWNIDTHGALVLPDGSVVFNFEYGGLVKLDRCGNVVWKLARQSHHSVELAEDGGFWVPGRRFLPAGSESPFPNVQTPFNENTIMKVSKDGKVLKEISVPKLFYDNGLEAVLTSNRVGNNFARRYRSFGREIVHLNKIVELPSDIAEDFPAFEIGDLLLSLCYLQMVLVVNPDTGEIKWWQIGPWLRQHDPEFKPGGTIIIFNNNVYSRHETSTKGLRINSGQYGSNILEINPVSNDQRIIYGNKRGQEMLSVIRGKHELTRNGGLLITEFEGGRVFEVDSEGRIVWEFINRYDSDEVAEISEGRIYPESYFTFNVDEWPCK